VLGLGLGRNPKRHIISLCRSAIEQVHKVQNKEGASRDGQKRAGDRGGSQTSQASTVGMVQPPTKIARATREIVRAHLFVRAASMLTKSVKYAISAGQKKKKKQVVRECGLKQRS
jgi:hypothetical protein